MSSIIFLSAGDIGSSFRKLIDETFIRVDGCLVERTANGYKLWGKEYNTMKGVQDAISAAKQNLSKSINRK